jgi:Porin subfamily
MKLAKSLLLGSAAGLAAVTGAQAADLPSRKAEAVEYVRVCSTYGAGFFYVPGTDSCLRISGRLRADYRYNEPQTRVQDAFGWRVRGRVNFDHRTATSYGLLRTYIRYELDRDSGSPFTAAGQITTNPKLQQGFIQFGGLTAGRVTSFFSNADLPTTHMGTLRFDDAPDVDVLAYTFSFGNGFSATIAAEDPLSRRVENLTIGGFGESLGFAVTDPNTGVVTRYTAGTRMPDIVANLKYAGTWGGVQLSGAAHQIRDVGWQFNPATPIAPFAPAIADTDYGFAVGLSAYVNLPMLGAGDNAWVFATYTDGALAYINGGQDAPNYSASISANPLSLAIADAFINGITGDIKTVKAWSIAGGVTHYWTPQWRSSVFGSYAQIDAPGIASTFDLVNGTRSGLVDFNEYRIGLNTFWLPLAGLQIGLEGLYTRVDPDGRVMVPVRNAVGDAVFPVSTSGEDIWEARLRIQRDF